MKKNLLQNPIVVAVLAVAAAGALFLQFRKPARKTSAASAAPQSASAVVAVTRGAPAGAPLAAGGNPLEPARSVDLAYIKQHLGKWVESPNRDPFGMYPKFTKEVSVTRTNASQVLRVSAIWRQTGQRLAVINDAVATEGSEILGFRIVQIDANVVRLNGPSGPDQIKLADFGASLPEPVATPVPTNQVPNVVATVPARKPSGG